MQEPTLIWLEADDDFPPVNLAWGEDSPLPGLLAAGGSLDAARLQMAYRNGIFPWFSPGQPNLWWSPDPRMVLKTADFRLHPSLRKTVRKFIRMPGYEVRIDTQFRQVIEHCAHVPRNGQNGTWIVPSIMDAYCDLHQQGLAHSVETWINDKLVGGLYCVALGQAVYGESMFAHATDASKVALAALVALCRHHGATQIDCQQATPHLASLGAHEQARTDFLAEAAIQQQQPAMDWTFRPVYWDSLC
ncbi:leucyl/phenylalanyl-tRNA--protein transferase [Comamonas sp.]|uniref:leucyl/phenylalanyl-tRNA--protein transferase n=1 Tax=Comamonas sp. TaxID=34028 RepID=UPI00258EB3EA|nr:leucyl/phenylalanyl-tRNA--protein transferase [Comamonas sp.]